MKSSNSFIDQVVGEIIVKQLLCALRIREKLDLGLQAYRELNYYSNYILNRSCLTNQKQNNSYHCT